MQLKLVRATTGARWVQLGMRTFFKQPLALAGLFFMFMVLMSVVSMVPLIGLPLALTLLPAGTLGLMEASRLAALSRFPMPLVLLSGLRAGPVKRRALLLLGVCYAGGFLCALGVTFLVDGGGFARLYFGGYMPVKEMLESGEFIGAMWTFLAVQLPLSLLFWHAPALVYWQDIPPVKSLFFSMVACGRNFWALTVFALVWMAVLVGMVLALGFIGNLWDNPALVGTLFFPALLMLAAMFFTSLFFTYRDSFFDAVPPEEKQAKTP